MRRRLHPVTGWAVRHPALTDAALVALVLAALVALGGSDRVDDPAEWLLTAGLTVPLVWRRRAPAAVFGVMALVAFVQWLTTDLLLADVTLLFALFGVAAHERRRWTFPVALAVLELGAVLATVRNDAANPLLSFLTFSAFVVAAAALGTYVRTRREHIAALLARARQLERERDQQARLAVASERARIARELHDVVAHKLTVMIALADGAGLHAQAAPADAEAAMRSVSLTGREALGEMRRLLGVLRDAGGTDAAGPLHPQPGLDQLDALIDQVRATGLRTRLTRTGRPVPLSPSAQLTVYRVVQEALTNTLKHAPSASAAEVRLHYGSDALTLEVTDDGAPVREPAVATAASGHGLIGMRERAAAVGAEVDAGPGPRGGWRIQAELPFDRGSASP